MPRSRLIAPLTGLAASLAASPILATLALAADPTVVVKAGDTLTGIARRSGVTVGVIVDLNQLADPNRIYVGQLLSVGVESAPATASHAPVPTDTSVHVVARGENLTVIARRYGVTVAAMVQANALNNPSRILAGQRLIIPGTVAPTPVAEPVAATPAAPVVALPAAAPASPVAAPVPPSATVVHVVARGENLTVIARRYGVTVAAIVQANALSNPSRILAGQRLTIPGADATTAPSAGPTAAMPASMAALVAQRDAIRAIIVEEANQLGVPAAFALAVAWQESGWRQEVVSRAGAVGVMQLMPATAVWVGGTMLGLPVEITDTRQNVRAGVRLLAHYLQRYTGNRELVLAAYYQGQSATDRNGIYAISRPYIASILLLERIFGG